MARERGAYMVLCEEITVTVTPKRVKMLRLRVDRDDGRVSMSVPYGTSHATAERFVREKIDWIRTARRHAEERPENKAQRGGGLSIFGTPVTVIYQEGKRGAERVGDTLFIGVARGADDAKREAALATYLRACLEREIAWELPRQAEVIGVAPTSWHTRRMTSRWGSCNTASGRICLNTNLIYYPRACLTYVIIHELCHLHISGHGKNFWARVARYCPRYKDISRILKGK